MTGTGRTAQLHQQRFEQKQRLQALLIRLDETDPGRQPRAHNVIRESIRAAKRELARIEGELNGQGAVVVIDQPDEAEQARIAMRGRLQHLQLALVHAPPSCAAVVRELKAKIVDELKQLERGP